MKQLTTGSRVKVDVYKNGYYVHSYRGEVIGFTKAGLVKVKPDAPMANIKCVSADNVKVVNEPTPPPPEIREASPIQAGFFNNQNQK